MKKANAITLIKNTEHENTVSTLFAKLVKKNRNSKINEINYCKACNYYNNLKRELVSTKLNVNDARILLDQTIDLEQWIVTRGIELSGNC